MIQIGGIQIEVLYALWIRELIDNLPHRLTVERESLGDAPAQDYDGRIICVHNHLDQFTDMVAEFIHDGQRGRIPSGRRDSGVLSCGPLTHEETAAAVIFVILVEIRNTTYLARTGIASVIKASVYYERSSHTCAESGAESLLVAFC